MRRTIYLAVVFLMLAGTGLAQQSGTEGWQRKQPELRPQFDQKKASDFHRFPNQSGVNSANRAPCHGDTIFYEDFANQFNGNNTHGIGWDTTGNGQTATDPWQACNSNCQSSGQYPIGPLNSTTASNGYVLADVQSAFGYISSAAGPPPELHLEMDSAIDLTGYDQPVVSVQTIFRYCCAFGHNVYMEVSTDTGWYRFNLSRYYETNIGPPNPTTFTFGLEEAISSNQDSVKIRFTWPPTESQGYVVGYYSWLIDDVVIREGHKNDLSITQSAAMISKNSQYYNSSSLPTYENSQGVNFGIDGVYPGEYTIIPDCNLDSLRLGGQLCNMGRNSVDSAMLQSLVRDEASGNFVYADSTMVQLDSMSCYGGNIHGYQPPYPDTLWAPTEFMAYDTGTYTVLHQAAIGGDTADCYFDNNTGVPEQAVDRFRISDSTYGIDDYPLYGQFFRRPITTDPNQGSYPTMTIYNVFDFTWFDSNVDTVKQICFHVHADSTDVGASVTAGLSAFSGDVYGQSSIYTITAQDTGSWVCLDIAYDANGNPINGVAVPKNSDTITTAFVEHQGGSQNFGVSASGYHRFWQYKSWYYWQGENNPYTTNTIPAIRVAMNGSRRENTVVQKSVCDSFTTSGGQTYYTDGQYQDTAWGTPGSCAGIHTADVTVYQSKSKTIDRTGCTSYTVPSGDETYTSPGTYMDTIPTARGCDSVLTINLTLGTPDTSVTKIDSTATLEANLGGANSYQWVECGGSAISGATSQSFQPSQNGDYAVVIDQGGGCMDTSNCHTITTVGIGDYREDAPLALYPNPTKGDFTLELGKTGRDLRMRITDLQGRVVKERESINSARVQFELDQPEGVYLVHLSNEETNKVIKLVKK